LGAILAADAKKGLSVFLSLLNPILNPPTNMPFDSQAGADH
jgi:hypothetical protein